MGKTSAAHCNVNHQDQIWKDYVKKEMALCKVWQDHWGFLPLKYQEMRRKAEKAGVVTQKSSLASSTSSLKLPPLQAPKQDTSRPFPKVTSHEIGWRSKREDSLEVFGRWGKPCHSIINQLKWPNDAVP